MNISLLEENKQVLNLVQAMIGAISPNLRRATLEMSNFGELRLRFVLECDDPEDRDEIEDIAFEFEALQEEHISIDVEVIVDSRPIAEITLPGRVVFGRKE